MKPRNYHALNAIQRKGGFHSGKRRPDFDSTEEQRDDRSMDQIRAEIDDENEGLASLFDARGQVWIGGLGLLCNGYAGEFEV